MPDILFQTPDEDWLTSSSLPVQPLPVWDTSELVPITLIDRNLPIIFGNQNLGPGPLTLDPSSPQPSAISASSQSSTFHLPIDIFGSAFFMLSRYEEVVKSERDEHNRFPAWASLAFQEGFLERPIIYEYVELLWAVIKRLWPGIERKKRTYQVHLTHDVDSVLYGPFAGVPALIKQMAGDCLKRKEFDLAWKRMKAVFNSRRGFFDNDPHNTFDFIMSLSEKYGLKSAFYFMTGGCSSRDAAYDINMPWIKKLIQSIGERGHEVGIHPSYESYLDSEAIYREFQALLGVTQECGIRQNTWGGRQHNLRWSVRQTWRNWAEAGLNYDSTLGYAQHAGFRTGTCVEYPVYDLATRTPLSLRERPLIVMDGTLINSGYMGLDYHESTKIVQNISNMCKLMKGKFTLLWHNGKLVTRRNRDLYNKIIRIIT